MNTVIWLSELILGLVFAAAGLSKLADRAGSREAMTGFGVPPRLVPPLAVLLPLAELAVALALISRQAWYGAAAALALLLVFLAGIGYNLALGRRPDCRCFGQLHSQPVGPSTIVRNVLLAGLAMLILRPGRGAMPVSLLDQARNLMAGHSIAFAVGGLALVVAVGLVWFLGKLLVQHGRMLSRIEALESRLQSLAQPGSAGAQQGPAAPAPQGLPIGAAAPDFHLAELSGQEAGLSDLLAPGLPVLLMFMDPGCGPCTALVPELSRWSREHGEKMRLAVISRGKPKDNRAKYGSAGLEHVLLQDNYEVAERYSAHGTPSAVLVRPDGRIGSSLLQGADAIKGVFDRARNGNGGNGSAPAAQLNQPGLGAPAPEIRLPDLEGKTEPHPVSGRETVVLFWNPGCGFCQRMREDLLQWEAGDGPGKPELLVVSAGTAESNRAEGLRSTVLLDSSFATASKFGAGGTPSAVLIDAQGRIASPVAVGAQAVLSLLQPLEAAVPSSRS